MAIELNRTSIGHLDLKSAFVPVGLKELFDSDRFCVSEPRMCRFILAPSERSMMCGVFGPNQCVSVLQISAFLMEGAVC